MKILQKLVADTPCTLHNIRFEAMGQTLKGFSITSPNIKTGFTLGKGSLEHEIMEFEPWWDSLDKSGKRSKKWKVSVHNAPDSPLGWKVIFIKPFQFEKELKKYLG